MKKIASIAAIALAACCTVGVAGCGKKTKNIAALSSNWYAYTSYRQIQPTMIEGNDNFVAEKITYSVTHDGSVASNATYTVTYGEGEYITEFYAKTLNPQTLAQIVHAEHLEGYMTSVGTKGLTVYCYKTELTMPSVQFTLKKTDEKSEVFSDSIVTESYFLSVANYLRPVYSTQTVKSATPANLQVSELSEAIKQIDRVYKSYYSYDGSEVISEVADNLAENKDFVKKDAVKLDKSKNTLFDNYSMNIAVRAMNLTGDLTQVISLYSPEGGVQDYTLTGSTDALVLNDSAKQAIESKLKDNGLYVAAKDEEGKETGLDTVAVRVTYTGGELTGVSQKYWFTAVQNKRNNNGRAVMVKMAVPVPFSLGTLNYTLKEVNSTLWDK